MPSNSSNKDIVKVSQPSSQGKAQVNLDKSEFDVAISINKGSHVYVDKSIRCPCKSRGADSKTDCRNCGGSGYVYINRYQTRLLLQGANLSNKFKEWSEENRGNVRFTARAEERLSFMDRITLFNSEAVFTENVYVVKYGEELVAKASYEIKGIEEAFYFEESSRKLRRLIEDVDFKIQEDRLILVGNDYDSVEPTISIRYRHSPSYYIIDFNREVMNTDILDTNSSTGVSNVPMPIHGIARRAHYVLDADNFSGTYLFDNSYEDIDCNSIVLKDIEEPSDFSITLVGSDALLSWEDNSEGKASYIVSRAEGSSSDFIQIEILSAGTTSYTDNSREPGKIYTYRLYAIQDGRYSCEVLFNQAI